MDVIRTGILSRHYKALSALRYSFFAKRSMRFQFTLLTISIVLLPMLVTSIYVSILINSEMIARTNKDITLLTQQVNENVEQKFKTLDDFTKLIVSNRVIRNELFEPSTDGNEYLEVMRKIRIEDEIKYLSIFGYSARETLAVNNNILERIYLFKDEDVFFKGFQNDGLREGYYDAKHLALYKYSRENRISNSVVPPSAADPTIYLLRGLQNGDSAHSFEEFILDLDERSVAASYTNGLKYAGAQWFLIDNQNRLLSANDKESLGTTAQKAILDHVRSENTGGINLYGETYVASVAKLSSFDMTSVILIPKREVYGDLTRNMTGYLSIIGFILILSLLVGIRFSYKLTGPIKDISNKIKLVGNGNFNVRMPAYDNIELDRLSHVFNGMTEKMDHLINDVYQNQILLKESEIKSLHAQMNPHFMFNVLMTIGLQAKMSNNDLIYKMVSAFNQLLQANINFSGNEMITLREELKYIDFYLYLQNIRYEGAIHYQLDIQSEALLDSRLPKFCIQPLIENAVVHGLEQHQYEGTITLSVTRHADLLFIEVNDDGGGFDADKLDLVNRKMPHQPDDVHNHIGLSNINRRVKLIYGPEYGIAIRNDPARGSIVTVTIPADRGGFNDDSSHDRG